MFFKISIINKFQHQNLPISLASPLVLLNKTVAIWCMDSFQTCPAARTQICYVLGSSAHGISWDTHQAGEDESPVKATSCTFSCQEKGSFWALIFYLKLEQVFSPLLRDHAGHNSSSSLFSVFQVENRTWRKIGLLPDWIKQERQWRNRLARATTEIILLVF